MKARTRAHPGHRTLAGAWLLIVAACAANQPADAIDLHDVRPVAVLVEGVGGPPGALKLELAKGNTAKLQLETTLWTRVVVHLLDEPTGEGQLLWVSRRHDLLRLAPLYQQLAHHKARATTPRTKG